MRKPTNNQEDKLNEERTERNGKTSNSSSRSNKGKGRRSNSGRSNNKTSGGEKPEVKNKTTYLNDPTWYYEDAEVAEQATQLSFQNVLGNPNVRMGSYQIPTIMTMQYNPSCGNTFQGMNPTLMAPVAVGINLASTKLFNKLSMNSGRNMAYAPQDVATMLLAMGELLHLVSYGRRLFGVIKPWNVRNRMLPKKLVEAMGIDADDFIQHYSDYRTRFNTFLMAMNQIPIIDNCGYLQKCKSFYDYVFSDSESPMSQLYVPVPFTTWIIDEQSYQGGTILKTKAVTGDTTNGFIRRTFASFMYDILEPIGDALLYSSTMNLVYADLLNLASKDGGLNFYSFSPIDETYTVVPIHDEHTLRQIHNTSIIGAPAYIGAQTGNFTPENDVYPLPAQNSLIYNPCFSLTESVKPGYIQSDLVVDAPYGQLDLAERIEITRYLAAFTNNQPTIGGTQYNSYVILPDCYCVNGLIWTDEVVGVSPIVVRTSISDATWNDRSQMMDLATFDWHPMIINYDKSQQFNNISGFFGDLNYWTTIPADYIYKLNNICFMSLFDIRGLK